MLAEVLEVLEVKGRKAVILKLLEGDLQVGQILTSKANGSAWRIRGFSFAPVESWIEGKRGVLLELVDGLDALRPGDFLQMG